jgi:gluconate 2-dehydrogenase gamma chain
MRTGEPEQPPFEFLTKDEAKILEAIAERIFPATDTPGAVEMGAIRYIDIALAGDYAALLPLYRQGLHAVDRYTRTAFGQAFRSLSGESQDAVLAAFETSSIPGYKNAAEFFETVRCHVLEGVFCEPHYGGNKDMMGWRLVDFPGQQFGYTDPYINERVDLEPVAINPDEIEKKPS